MTKLVVVEDYWKFTERNFRTTTDVVVITKDGGYYTGRIFEFSTAEKGNEHITISPHEGNSRTEIRLYFSNILCWREV